MQAKARPQLSRHWPVLRRGTGAAPGIRRLFGMLAKGAGSAFRPFGRISPAEGTGHHFGLDHEDIAARGPCSFMATKPQCRSRMSFKSAAERWRCVWAVAAAFWRQEGTARETRDVLCCRQVTTGKSNG